MPQVVSHVMIEGQDYHAEIAKIRSTYLGLEDHGMFMVNLDFDLANGGCQGLGRVSELSNVGNMVVEIDKVIGVPSWEYLKGNTCFVLKEKDSLSSLIVGILSMDNERYTLFNK